MTEFQRRLGLGAHSAAQMASTPWLVDLLRNWYPSGHAMPMVEWVPTAAFPKASPGLRPTGLRLAIRNGYVNFYCGGQSIARVSIGQRLTAETHEKYVTDAEVDGQRYVKLGSITPQIKEWVARSHGYQGIEKLFVEAVCAANGTLIDLEMALPSLSVLNRKTGAAQLVAPRIDLVALEPSQGGWTVVFWEAKLTSDSRVRTRGDAPEVVEQLAQYAEWFGRDGKLDEVLRAYRNTCALLALFHNRATEMGLEVPPLNEAILAIAEDPVRLEAIDPKVRLLIDDRQDDAKFRNKFLPKLERARIPVHLVRSDADLVLPTGPAAA